MLSFPPGELSPFIKLCVAVILVFEAVFYKINVRDGSVLERFKSSGVIVIQPIILSLRETFGVLRACEFTLISSGSGSS